MSSKRPGQQFVIGPTMPAAYLYAVDIGYRSYLCSGSREEQLIAV